MGPVKTLSLAARAGLLKPSPTLAMTSRARAMQAQGCDVISFAAGEPDFDTPSSICESAQKAIRDGQTRYCASAGLPKLREAVSEKLLRENRLTVSPDQVVVSCGAKHAIFNCLQVLVDPGDEVILIAPYWMTYRDQIVLAGGTPVVIPTTAETNFSPTREQLQAAVSPRTKAIIINSPSNPTGAAFDRRTLKELAEFALRHQIWVISDEIYERLIYGDEHTSIATLGKEIADQTITVTGVSKTYAMTGWRIGFSAGPLPVMKAISNLQDQVTSNATTFSQVGAIAALNLPAEEVEAMRAEFQARRDLMHEGLSAIPNVGVTIPAGAFYHFPDFSTYLRDGFTDLDLAEFILEKAEVATIPGSVFEGPGHLRLSYAASREEIARGVARIAEAVQQLT